MHRLKVLVKTASACTGKSVYIVVAENSIGSRKYFFMQGLDLRVEQLVLSQETAMSNYSYISELVTGVEASTRMGGLIIPTCFFKYLPIADQLQAKRAQTCAVVAMPSQRQVGGGASTHHLRIGSRGSEIDAHDVIIRLNFGPVREELAKHIGRKTSIRVHTHADISTVLGPTACGHHGTSSAPYHFSEYCISGIQYERFFVNFANIVERAHTAGPIPLLYSPQLLSKLQELHARVASALPGWSPYRFPSTGQLAILLAINLCEAPPNLYGFFLSQQTAHDSSVTAGDLFVPFHDSFEGPTEVPWYRPRDLYQKHSMLLEHYVLEYLQANGAINWIR